jgi:hypothetical protein
MQSTGLRGILKLVMDFCTALSSSPWGFLFLRYTCCVKIYREPSLFEEQEYAETQGSKIRFFPKGQCHEIAHVTRLWPALEMIFELKESECF